MRTPSKAEALLAETALCLSEAVSRLQQHHRSNCCVGMQMRGRIGDKSTGRENALCVEHKQVYQRSQLHFRTGGAPWTFSI